MKRKTPKPIALDGGLLREFGVKRIVRERIVEEFEGGRMVHREVRRQVLEPPWGVRT